MDLPTSAPGAAAETAQTVDEFAATTGDAEARPDATRESVRAPFRQEWSEED